MLVIKVVRLFASTQILVCDVAFLSPAAPAKSADGFLGEILTSGGWGPARNQNETDIRSRPAVRGRRTGDIVITLLQLRRWK